MRGERRILALMALAMVVLVAASLLAGCGSKSDGNSGTENSGTGSNSGDNGSNNGQAAGDQTSESKDVSVGDEFTIELESNPTTGYDWTMTTRPDQAVLGLTSDTYAAPDTGLMGAPGMRVYRFKALGQGQTTMVFEYARSFEPDVPPVKTHTVNVVVH